jgi:hypothetical protein
VPVWWTPRVIGRRREQIGDHLISKKSSRRCAS